MTTTAASPGPEEPSGPRTLLHVMQFPALVVLPLFGSFGREWLGSSGWVSVLYLFYAAVPMFLLQLVVLVLTMLRARRVGRQQVGPLTAWPMALYVVGAVLGPLAVADATDQPGTVPSVLENSLGLPPQVSTVLFVLGSAATVIGGVAMLVTASMELRAAPRRGGAAQAVDRVAQPGGPVGHSGPLSGPLVVASGTSGSIERADVPTGTIDRADPAGNTRAATPTGPPDPGAQAPVAQPLRAQPLQARPLQAQPLQARPTRPPTPAGPDTGPGPAPGTGAGAGTRRPEPHRPHQRPTGSRAAGPRVPGAGDHAPARSTAQDPGGGGTLRPPAPAIRPPSVPPLGPSTAPVSDRASTPSAAPVGDPGVPPSSAAPTAPLAPLPPAAQVPPVGPLSPAGPAATQGSVAPAPSDALNDVDTSNDADATGSHPAPPGEGER